MTRPCVTLELPLDEAAEEALAGIAIDSQRGAQLALARTEACDFWDQRHRRVIEAGANVAARDRDDRVRQISAATDEFEAHLRRLADAPRISLVDEAGAYPRRISAAASGRTRLLAFLDETGTT